MVRACQILVQGGRHWTFLCRGWSVDRGDAPALTEIFQLSPVFRGQVDSNSNFLLTLSASWGERRTASSAGGSARSIPRDIDVWMGILGRNFVIATSRIRLE